MVSGPIYPPRQLGAHFRGAEPPAESVDVAQAKLPLARGAGVGSGAGVALAAGQAGHRTRVLQRGTGRIISATGAHASAVASAGNGSGGGGGGRRVDAEDVPGDDLDLLYVLGGAGPDVAEGAQAADGHADLVPGDGEVAAAEEEAAGGEEGEDALADHAGGEGGVVAEGPRRGQGEEADLGLDGAEDAHGVHVGEVVAARGGAPRRLAGARGNVLDRVELEVREGPVEADCRAVLGRWRWRMPRPYRVP